MAGLARKMCFIAMVASEEASGSRGSGDWKKEGQTIGNLDYQQQRVRGSASGRQISVKGDLGGGNFHRAASVQEDPKTYRLPGPYPIGTNVGATVKRADGWDHGDQDGGAGKLGEITSVGTGDEVGKVNVRWDDADDANGQGTDNVYRMGYWKNDRFDATKGAAGYDLKIVDGITSSQADRRAEAQRQRPQQQQQQNPFLASTSSQSGYQRHVNAPSSQQPAGWNPNDTVFRYDSSFFDNFNPL